MSYDYQHPWDVAPEDMKPGGVMTLLVGITRHGDFNYYVLPRNLVYLDASKGDGGALEAGLEGRYGIETVDEAHEDVFFQAIEPYKRSCARLRDELYSCRNRFDRRGYYIEVLIDFDRKQLVSNYSEPFYFEDNVPEGWTAERVGIGYDGDYFWMNDGPDGKPERNIGISGMERDYIPLDKRFWIDENGKSLFELLYQEGVASGREKPYVPWR